MRKRLHKAWSVVQMSEPRRKWERNDFRLILIGKRYNQNVVPALEICLEERPINFCRQTKSYFTFWTIHFLELNSSNPRSTTFLNPSQRKRHTAVKSDFWISAVSKIQLFSAGVKNLHNTSSLGSAIETMAKSTLVQKRKKLSDIHKLVADTQQRGYK